MALAAGSVLACLLVELGLRLVSPPWLQQRMAELNAGDAEQGGSDRDWPVVIEGDAFRQFEPFSRFEVRHYEYRNLATIDELGGRTTAHQVGDKELLPFMGDSFTFGVGVEDDETFVSRLAEAMPGRLLNLGMSGTALQNQLDTLEIRHEELGRPPSYVFSLFMGNDLTNIRRSYERSAVDGSAKEARGDQRFIFGLNVFVYHHSWLKRSHALQFLRQKLLIVMNRSSSGFMDPFFLAARGDGVYLEESLVFLRRELTRLRDVSESLQFDYVFVLIPDVHQIDAERRRKKAESIGLQPDSLAPESIAQAIASVLDESEIRYLDIGPCLARGNVAELYYTQDTHFTSAGHAAAASCILESGLLDSIKAPEVADRSSGLLLVESP